MEKTGYVPIRQSDHGEIFLVHEISIDPFTADEKAKENDIKAPSFGRDYPVTRIVRVTIITEEIW